MSEQLAEEFQSGEKTIRRDGKFAEAVDRVVEHCGPEARNLLLSRETGLTRGGVLRLAKLKPEEQRRFIQELQTSGRRPRKPRKESRTGRKQATVTLPTQPRAMARALAKQMGPAELAEFYKALAEVVESRGEGQDRERTTERPSKRKGKAAK